MSWICLSTVTKGSIERIHQCNRQITHASIVEFWILQSRITYSSEEQERGAQSFAKIDQRCYPSDVAGLKLIGPIINFPQRDLRPRKNDQRFE